MTHWWKIVLRTGASLENHVKTKCHRSWSDYITMALLAISTASWLNQTCWFWMSLVSLAFGFSVAWSLNLTAFQFSNASCSVTVVFIFEGFFYFNRQVSCTVTSCLKVTCFNSLLIEWGKLVSCFLFEGHLFQQPLIDWVIASFESHLF